MAKATSGRRNKTGPVAAVDRDPELMDRICDLVRAGNYIETAAASAGVTRDSLYRWMRQRPEFAERVHKAQAESEARDVLLIGKAATEQWQAAAWRLERRNPRKWGARVQISVQEELSDVLDRIERTTDAETYTRILEAIAADAGSEKA